MVGTSCDEIIKRWKKLSSGKRNDCISVSDIELQFGKKRESLFYEYVCNFCATRSAEIPTCEKTIQVGKEDKSEIMLCKACAQLAKSRKTECLNLERLFSYDVFDSVKSAAVQALLRREELFPASEKNEGTFYSESVARDKMTQSVRFVRANKIKLRKRLRRIF